jgi:hypothetical protein
MTTVSGNGVSGLLSTGRLARMSGRVQSDETCAGERAAVRTRNFIMANSTKCDGSNAGPKSGHGLEIDEAGFQLRHRYGRVG